MIIIGLAIAGSAFSLSRALGTKPNITEIEGSFVGIFRQDAPANMGFIRKFEKDSGKKPAMIMWYQDWSCKFPKDACDNAWAYGAVPHIVWEPWYWGDMETIKLDNINRGEFDDYIKSWAEAIKAWGNPIFLRVGHEFNIDGYPWGVINNDKDPKKYIKAYRRVVDIFKKEGVSNVKWVWCFMNFSYPDEPWNDYEAAYPGDDYVDWIGIDGYNWGTTQTWSDWQSFQYLFRDQMRRMRKLHPTKPIMVAEFASTEKGGDKAVWTKKIPQFLKVSMKDIAAIIWFDIRKETDWRIKSSEGSLKAFKQIMEDEYFLSSGEALANFIVGEKKRERKLAKALEAKSEIKLDGDLSDFSDTSPIYLNQREDFKEGIAWWGTKDLSGKIFIKWDNDNLYIAAKVNDNYPFVNQKRRGDIWNGDAIEFVLSTNPKADPVRQEFSGNDYQIGLGTGDGKENSPSIWIWQKYSQPKGSKIVVKKTSTGYNLEAMIPWESFTKFRPRSGVKVDFDIALDDADTAERKAQLIWNGDYAFYRDPSVWGTLQFSE